VGECPGSGGWHHAAILINVFIRFMNIRWYDYEDIQFAPADFRGFVTSDLNSFKEGHCLGVIAKAGLPVHIQKSFFQCFPEVPFYRYIL
jgi:hypothetical protein